MKDHLSQNTLTQAPSLTPQTLSCHFYCVLCTLGVSVVSEEMEKCIVLLAQYSALHRKLSAGETWRESSAQAAVGQWWPMGTCGLYASTPPPRLTRMHTLLWELPDFPFGSTTINRESKTPGHQSCQRTLHRNLATWGQR